MVVLALLAAVAAAALALTTLALLRSQSRNETGGPRADLVRYCGMAAVAALTCGAMNIIEPAGGGTAAAAAGNATNLVAIGLVWAGARRVNTRPAIGAISTGAGGILMFGLTYLVPLDDATLVKTAGLAVFSALGALEFSRRPLGELHGARLMTWTLGIYAGYSVARLAVVAAVGMGPLFGRGPVSAETTAAVSAVTIALVSLAAVRVGRQLDDAPVPGTRAHDRESLRAEAAALLAADSTAQVTIIRVPELDLIRAAHSSERAETMMRVLVDAAGEAIPRAAAGIPARDAVFVVSPVDDDTLARESAVRRAFAARMPGIGYDDVPDLSFQHDTVRDVGRLSQMLESRRLRPR
ncbi:hypothetical protein [Microbacterium trichothecenolyticum]|uniref:GGDEF domain-containing protein n=1 Tax=Microbacterium trichothecenolyticum TaxID=69370 RepID=A0ABU0TUE8_MICTR|nr:hypothetical protein [Microbacterium trichothecenolyticum]MDQ1123295.1 hypothetical protein [Microbacterium trichothecenolyticum]